MKEGRQSQISAKLLRAKSHQEAKNIALQETVIHIVLTAAKLNALSKVQNNAILETEQ
jgi:hypothetical protein